MTCEHCSGELLRKRCESIGANLRAAACILPYRCERCHRETLRIRWEQASFLYGAVTVCLVFSLLGVVWYRTRHQPKPPEARLNIAAALPDGAIIGERRSDTATQGGPPVIVRIEYVIKNEDIAEMAEAKIGPDVMLQVIRTSPHLFHIDPKSLVLLKKAGTPDEVISNMIDTTLSGQSGVSNMPQGLDRPVSFVVTQ